MSFRGITFQKQLCKSEDDALIFDTFLNSVKGKVRGCSVTFSDVSVFMGVGYFMSYGRLIHVDGQEILTPTPIEVGTQYNRLVFTIDLSKENTASVFSQGYFQFLTSYDAYPTLKQEDLFNGGYIYQLPIAKFTLTVNGISNFAEEMGSVNISEVWTTLKENLTDYRSQYDEYFTQYKREFLDFFNTQEQIILQMISDLQDKNFVTTVVFNQSIENLKDTIYDGEVEAFITNEDGEVIETEDYSDLVALRKIKFY